MAGLVPEKLLAQGGAGFHVMASGDAAGPCLAFPCPYVSVIEKHVEDEKNKAENDKKAKISNAKNDSKAI